MPLQNRVTPFGELVPVPERGLFMGNRGGQIHDPATRRLGKRLWASKQWICCVTRFKDRHRPVMGCGYTELFFLDEVTALSAGHRPCFECRRAEANAFARMWAAADGLPAPPRAAAMDRVLHRERLVSGRRNPAPVVLDGLPDGVMVSLDGVALAVKGDDLLRWGPAGYDRLLPRRDHERANLLTPATIVAVLRQGYMPRWHASATDI